MQRRKDYTDKEGNKWEVYTRDVGFWRQYYMGLSNSGGEYDRTPPVIRLAFAINKEHDYNGHKKEVIMRNLADFAENNRYSKIEKGE